MERTRRSVVVALGAGILGLSGCGADSNGDGTTVGTPSTPTATPSTSSAGPQTDTIATTTTIPLRLVVSVDNTAAVGQTTATFRGQLDAIHGVDSVTVGFRYRVSGGSWTTVSAGTRDEPGHFSAEVTGLQSDTTYTVEATASAAGTTVTSESVSVRTAGAQASPITYRDGFADVLWFDDAVDVYRIGTPSREQLEGALHASGPRVIVFETSGVFDLGEERLTLDEDDCWIAGQTAPAPGVTLIRGGLRVTADNCVLQHIRVRPGDAGNDGGWEPDGIRTGDGTRNNIIDHCSVSWGIDENLSPGYDAVDTTISNCLIAEALENSSHHKGPHSMGSLVGDRSVGNALLGNVFAHNKRRNPRLKADSRSVVANNLIYHFHSGTAMGSTGTAAVVGNVYRRPKADFNISGGKQDGEVPDLYHADNSGDVNVAMTNGQFTHLEARPFWPARFRALDAETVASYTSTRAGARPADRTATDDRVLQQVANDTGRYLDSQIEVGGYPDLAVNNRSLSVPDTDLRQWLEQWAAAVEKPTAQPPG